MRYSSIIVLVLVVGAGAFYGGMTFQKARSSSVAVAGDLQNLSPQERQQRFAGRGGAGASGARFRAGGASSGDVISKDATSLTVRLRDGGSRIVFYSTSTNVGKMAQGSLSDVIVGGQITVMGNPNSDGSITADSIQLRPAGRVDNTNATTTR